MSVVSRSVGSGPVPVDPHHRRAGGDATSLVPLPAGSNNTGSSTILGKRVLPLQQGSPALYFGGIAQEIDPGEYGKYQDTFYELQEALLDCQMIGENAFSVTINFKDGTCRYRGGTGSPSAPANVVNILRPNLENPGYDEEKFNKLQGKIKEFQGLCDDISRNIAKKQLLKVAVKESNRNAADITLNVSDDFSGGSYTLKGDPKLYDFDQQFLERIKKKVSSRSEGIYEFTCNPDRRHILVKSAAKVEAISKKQCIGKPVLAPRVYTRGAAGTSAKCVQANTDASFKESIRQIQDRASFRVGLLGVVGDHVTKITTILESILGKIESDPTLLRDMSKEDFNGIFFASEVLTPMAERLASEELRTSPTTRQISVKKNQLKVKYSDFCFKYIQELRTADTTQEQIVQTKETLRNGSANVEFILKYFDSEKLQVLVEDFAQLPFQEGIMRKWTSQNEKWRNFIRQHPNYRNSVAIEAALKSIVSHEVQELGDYMLKIQGQVKQTGGSIKDCKECIKECIQSLKPLEKGDSTALKHEYEQGSLRAIDRSIKDCQGSSGRVEELQKKKESRLMFEVYKKYDLNHNISASYGYWIRAGRNPDFFNSWDLSLFQSLSGPLSTKDAKPIDQWKVFKSCFAHAKSNFLARWSVWSKVPSKEDRMQALINAFSLLVPQDFHGEFVKLVQEESKSAGRDFTIPHDCQEIRELALAHKLDSVRSGSTVWYESQ